MVGQPPSAAAVVVYHGNCWQTELSGTTQVGVPQISYIVVNTGVAEALMLLLLLAPLRCSFLGRGL